MNRNINERLNTNIKEWYSLKKSNDETIEFINDNVTFRDIYNALKESKDVFSVLGCENESLRINVFNELSVILQKDYEEIYKLSLSKNVEEKQTYTYIINVPVYCTLELTVEGSTLDEATEFFKCALLGAEHGSLKNIEHSTVGGDILDIESVERGDSDDIIQKTILEANWNENNNYIIVDLHVNADLLLSVKEKSLSNAIVYVQNNIDYYTKNDNRDVVGDYSNLVIDKAAIHEIDYSESRQPLHEETQR